MIALLYTRVNWVTFANDNTALQNPDVAIEYGDVGVAAVVRTCNFLSHLL